MTMTETELTQKPAWWVSWFSPKSLGGFYLESPWWVSGWYYGTNDEEVNIFVSAVRADSAEAAYELIANAYETPVVFTDANKRFCERLDEAAMPWDKEGTRFPLQDWMIWE